MPDPLLPGADPFSVQMAGQTVITGQGLTTLTKLRQQGGFMVDADLGKPG